jgi:hypothetical protein
MYWALMPANQHSHVMVLQQGRLYLSGVATVRPLSKYRSIHIRLILHMVLHNWRPVERTVFPFCNLISNVSDYHVFATRPCADGTYWNSHFLFYIFDV